MHDHDAQPDRRDAAVDAPGEPAADAAGRPRAPHLRGTQYVDAVPEVRHRRRLWPWVLGALLLLALLPLLHTRDRSRDPNLTYRVDTLTTNASTGEVGGAAGAGTQAVAPRPR